MTAKNLRNKGRVDYTGGVSREQKAINRRNKLESSLLSRGGDCLKGSSDRKERLSRVELEMRKYYASRVALTNLEEDLCTIEQQRFGQHLYDGELLVFEEISFGTVVKPGEKTYRTSSNVGRDLSSIVVSLALFDGDKMLFACSGTRIPLPYKADRLLQLTRFVTSAHLVRAFKNYRNRDDKLRVAVRLPDNTTTDGFLGLCDDDIAIVMCLGFLNVRTIDLNFKATPIHPIDSLLAAGRAFMSGSLVAMCGSSCRVCVSTWVPDSQDIFKAVLGGPLIGKDARFLRMVYDHYDHGDAIVRYNFLSLDLLCERLDRFEMLSPKPLHFRGYSLPEGVSSIVPSGFMKTINRIRSHGYPMPPPLVLEFNGRLLNQFEERFGDLLAWKEYPYGPPTSFSSECVWELLTKEVVTDISRRVVSLHSMVQFYSRYVRSFACTCLLIKWHGSKATRTIILTSASLVTSRHNEDDIDNTLTIEVFLPPNQRGSGTLEFYNLKYNIAIISVKKTFKAVRAVDIFSKIMGKPSEKVLAIGRCTKFGPLMATIGEVVHSFKGSNLDCKGLRVSTCKIKKAGIGGPRINFDGRFVGMNFYDRSGVTPFLPKDKIAQVLRGVIDSPLPSECAYDHPMPIDVGAGTKENRWPVPEPYWCHGGFCRDRYDIPKLRGRTLPEVLLLTCFSSK